jgi:hypothetical protein
LGDSRKSNRYKELNSPAPEGRTLQASRASIRAFPLRGTGGFYGDRTPAQHWFQPTISTQTVKSFIQIKDLTLKIWYSEKMFLPLQNEKYEISNNEYFIEYYKQP